MNFLLMEMTYLKYFYPIVHACVQRNIPVNIFVQPTGKYNNPCSSKSSGILKKLFGENVNIQLLASGIENQHPIITIEGVGTAQVPKDSKVYSLTYQTDFAFSYKKYKDQCENIFFISKKYAQFYDCLSEKNVYLGTPKFDKIPDRKEVFKKYKNLDEKSKHAFVLYPRKRDLNLDKLKEIYSGLKEENYSIIVKSRGKDPVRNDCFSRGDLYLEDEEWYPHPTLEALAVSDVVINFDSTGIEEAVQLRVPLINFRSKPFEPMLPFLYDYEYCVQVQKDIDLAHVKSTTVNSLKSLLSKNLTSAFNASIEANMSPVKNSANEILDFILKK
jgi:hypothetical protein